jgi:probable F420-dependent oxidoreductase
MLPADRFVPLARAAEESGFTTIAVPDSVFFPESVSADYPYSADGARFWAPETPFLDPFVAMAAMAAVTEHIRFVTNVVKLPLRDPLLVAKQLASLAVLSNDRVALGVGLSWIPEEFAWTRTDMRTRGARTNEMMEILRLVCAGRGPEFVEYHGKHYDFGRLMISPAPGRPVPLYVGGHSEPAFRRAARLGDGWISVQSTRDQLVEAVAELARYRKEYGRDHEPFEVNALCVDVFDLDCFRALEGLGVTELQAVPWYYYGGDANELATQIDGLHRFGDEVIAKYSA